MNHLLAGLLCAVRICPIPASCSEKNPDAPAEESAISAPSADPNAEPAAKTLEACANIQN